MNLMDETEEHNPLDEDDSLYVEDPVPSNCKYIKDGCLCFYNMTFPLDKFVYVLEDKSITRKDGSKKIHQIIGCGVDTFYELEFKHLEPVPNPGKYNWMLQVMVFKNDIDLRDRELTRFLKLTEDDIEALEYTLMGFDYDIYYAFLYDLHKQHKYTEEEIDIIMKENEIRSKKTFA
jgi:hypothetical protein